MDDNPSALASRWVDDSDISPSVLTMRVNWSRRWPGSRVADDGWLGRAEKSHLRLHALPQSKQYPSSSVEYATILHRHSVMLKELLALVGLNADEPLLVLSRSWSDSPVAVPRDSWLERLVPASLLVSYTEDPEGETDDEPAWRHTYVSELTVLDDALTSLLILLADDKTGAVTIMPPSLEWIYSPYPGGMDIRGLADKDRDRLKAAHSDWLPTSEDESSWVHVSEMQMDIPGWEFQTWHLTEASARRLAELAEPERLLFGRLVDPRRDLRLDLGRREAQLISIVLTNRSSVLVDEDGTRREVTPDDARDLLAELSYTDELHEFVNEYGYRPPSEAVDGVLPGRFWDPEVDYTGVTG